MVIDEIRRRIITMDDDVKSFVSRESLGIGE